MRSDNVRSLKPDFLIFLLALAARCVCFVRNGVLSAGDTEHYKHLARNLYHYGVYSLSAAPPMIPTIRRAPLYPFFLAGLSWITGGEAADPVIVIVQIVLDAAVAVLILKIAQRIVSLKYALVAAIIYTVHPGAIAYSCTILSESVFIFLCVAAVALLAQGLERDFLPAVALSGGGLALAALCRPIALPLLPIFAVVIVLSRRSTRGPALTLLLITGGGLVLAPWLVRCYRVAGTFVPVQGMSPAQFYIASRTDLNQLDESTLWPQLFGAETNDPYFLRLQKAETAGDLLAADRFAWRQAASNVAGQPGEYLRSRIRYFPHLFLSSFDFASGINESFGDALRRGNILKLAVKTGLLLFFSLFPLVLAGVGIWKAPFHWLAILCATAWGYTLLAHLPMWVEYRFWLPAVPFLLVSASVGVEAVCERVYRFRHRFGRDG